MRLVSLILICLAFMGCATSEKTPDPVIEGEFNRESVRFAIRDHLVPIRHCYEKELKTKPRLAGKSVLEWEVAGAGVARNVVIVQGFNADVDQCIAEEIKKIKFDPVSGNTIVKIRFPFTFSPTAKELQ